MANRDILVIEDGSWMQRWLYDATGSRLSVEIAYADGTARGETNAGGESGENFASDFAVNEIAKGWYRANLLGTTLYVAGADGDVTAHARYDAWGRPMTETYTDANFSGLESVVSFASYSWDETLSLWYAQARFYDSAAGRFISEDPARDGGNWYVYCMGNPVGCVDPWGLDCYVFFEPGMYAGAVANGQDWAVVQANQWADDLRAAYGTTVHVVDITDWAGFQREWAAMDDSQGVIEAFVGIFHSDPTFFESGRGANNRLDLQQIARLRNKNIDLLIWLGCNAGHLNSVDNVAAAFSNIPGVNKVIASDGTVKASLTDANGRGITGSMADGTWVRHLNNDDVSRTYMLDGNFEKLQCIDVSNRNSTNNENAGFILYQNGARLQLPGQTRLTEPRGSYLEMFNAEIIDYGRRTSLGVITMTIGDPYVTVNGNRQLADTETNNPQGSSPQLISGGRTMIPVRAIVEAMGGTVGWNSDTQEVTMQRNGVSVLMTIGNTAYFVNSDHQTMNVAPFIHNSRTFVPVRFVAEAFGAGVDWDQALGTAVITYFSMT